MSDLERTGRWPAQELVVLRRAIDEHPLFVERTGSLVGVELGGEYIGAIRSGLARTKLLRILGLEREP